MAYEPKRPTSKAREHQLKPFRGYHPRRIEGFIGRGVAGPSSHVFSLNKFIERDFEASLKSTGKEFRI